jgi:HAD superfamily hydrolase (TIGR01662 family)
LVRAVLFDLGDTMIDEEKIMGGHLWEATLQKLPHLDEVLTELKKRGYKLGVVTNTSTSREEHVRVAMQRIDIEKHFDVVVTSVDLGFGKPDERIFFTALRKLGVRPEETVMVGNRLDTDILGGKRAGMKTILLRWNDRTRAQASSQQEEPPRTITSLKELPKVLSEI